MPELNENLHILENIQLKLNIDKQDGSKNALEPVERNRDFLLQRNLISVSRNEKDQEQAQGEYPKEEKLEIIAGRECIGTEQNDEKLVEVAENNELSQPVKRKRGRPKGSKNNNVSDGSLSQAIPGAAEKRKSTRIPRELKSIMSGSDLKLPPTRERRKNDPLKQATKILPQKNEENEAASQSQASEDQANSTSAATKKRGPKKKEFISESESSNNVASEDSKQEQTSESVAMPRNGLKDKRTFINCDIRYFNLDFLVEQLGSFDIILVDPPWKRVPQDPLASDEMNHEYDALTSQELMNIRVEKLSHKGFIFLWTMSDQLNISYETLKRWGYEVIDQIIWVKMKDSHVLLSPGNNLMHSYEMCLVGYKCPLGEHVEYNSKISNNIIFANVKKKHQKPEELYDIIELLMPGSKKIELFARNHNLRPGWFSLGNQLGDLKDKEKSKSIACNECNKQIKVGIKRYKAKRQADYNICEKCFGEKGLSISNFFEIRNEADEIMIHQYHSCARCNSEPIWGTRFACIECDNYDLCETCYDSHLQASETEKFHNFSHEFTFYETPLPADGLPTHPDYKCHGCLQKPIVGTCFSCMGCDELHFCQDCYFRTPIEAMRQIKGHQPHHQFEILVDQSFDHIDISYKCRGCEINRIEGPVYKCDYCFGMYFCEKCYLKRESYKPPLVTSHKIYHSFTKINAS